MLDVNCLLLETNKTKATINMENNDKQTVNLNKWKQQVVFIYSNNNNNNNKKLAKLLFRVVATSVSSSLEPTASI